ncbi:MAG: hypothetical protein JSV51_03870 [Candidatus Bathyarchaeota archaeon]|nr:MAG: hypothetical protein JSV51_03870 [Candidatus Bathyarchaeota archaeon]
MEERIESLKKKYQTLEKGEGDALALKDETQLLLKEVRKKGNQKSMEELEDILIDLELSIEDNKCKCHRKSSR